MSASRFVVRRRNWRWAPGNEHTARGWVCFPGPGAEVAGFESFDAAEADRANREAAVRLKMNPFECGPLSAVSTLPDPILRDFLMDAGVEPPAAGVSWADWWAANRPALPHEHQARVWQAADVVRFFEVTEEPDGPQVHVVVDVTWEERAGVHVAEWDGGELIGACRTLRRAGEVARGRANQRRITLAGQHVVDAAPFADCRPSNVPDPFAPGSTRLLRLPRASFCEVLSIPFDESGDKGPDWGPPPRPVSGFAPRRRQVTVVVRRDYAPTQQGFRASQTDYRTAGVPVMAFTDWDRARDFCRDLERVARCNFNPFNLASETDDYGWWSPESIRRPLVEECRGYGIPLPESKCNYWEWWQEHVLSLPAEFRTLLFWAVFTGIEFYTVMKVVLDE